MDDHVPALQNSHWADELAATTELQEPALHAKHVETSSASEAEDQVPALQLRQTNPAIS